MTTEKIHGAVWELLLEVEEEITSDPDLHTYLTGLDLPPGPWGDVAACQAYLDRAVGAAIDVRREDASDEGMPSGEPGFGWGARVAMIGPVLR